MELFRACGWAKGRNKSHEASQSSQIESFALFVSETSLRQDRLSRSLECPRDLCDVPAPCPRSFEHNEQRPQSPRASKSFRCRRHGQTIVVEGCIEQDPCMFVLSGGGQSISR